VSENNFIDDMFSELDVYYPGSKRKRKEPVEKPILDTHWENDYTEKTLPNGSMVKMYLIGSLAKALSRPTKTIRWWTERGTLPMSPYRLPSTLGKDGQEYVGRRLYSKAMIDSTVELFQKAGLYEENPIDWSLHRNLSDKIAEAWETIRAEENK
jgi:hypothetical protein